MEKWKTRSELPATLKLDMKFDIERLRQDLRRLEATKDWDGLMSEYAGLCETHDQLPPFFLDARDTATTQSYQQLALSEFDAEFSLEKRAEKSGWFWDRFSPQNNVQADERFYRKPVLGIPPYLEFVLNQFRPYLHRARFAKLLPGRSVKPHVDYDTKYSCRLHIPIFTNAGCRMGIRYKNETHEEHWPADGSVFFINQGFSHWAINEGDDERVHLILSVDTQKFIYL